MKNTAIKILKSLEKHGEMSLEEIASLIPKKLKDHRDFYIFAWLVSTGYIENDHMPGENTNPNIYKSGLLSREYFASSTEEKTAKYENMTWSRGGDSTLKGQKFALSGKGSLYLAECREKRFERIFTLASGIVIGILVAIAGVLFNTYVK